MCEGDKERLVRGSRPTAIQGGWGGGGRVGVKLQDRPTLPSPPLPPLYQAAFPLSILPFTLSSLREISNPGFLVYIAGCMYTSLCTCMYVLGYKQSHTQAIYVSVCVCTASFSHSIKP